MEDYVELEDSDSNISVDVDYLYDQNDCSIEIGTICNYFEDKNEFVVLSRVGLVNAIKAFSCIVSLQMGDKVLFVTNEDQSYIVSVLQRLDIDKTSLEFQGNVELNVKDGTFEISAENNLNLISKSQLNIKTENLEITAIKGKVNIEDINASGQSISSNFKEMK